MGTAQDSRVLSRSAAGATSPSAPPPSLTATPIDDRGLFLERLRLEAGSAFNIHQVAGHLGLRGQELRDLLDADLEAKATWDLSRSRLRHELAEGLVGRVKNGERLACQTAERFLRSEEPLATFDYQHVPMSVMVAITGRSRQAIDKWVRRSGCPRSADGTFDLVEFLPWYAAWEKNKHGAQTIRTAVRAGLRAELAALAGRIAEAMKEIP